MTKNQNDAAGTNYDTMQEVGQWLLDNQHTLSRLEDAIQASNHSDTPTQEFMLIHRELGGVEQRMKDSIHSVARVIGVVEALKAKYGIP